MKTALVYPYTKKLFTGCNPPISLLYLAAALQQAGEDVIVLDVDEGPSTEEDLLERLRQYDPDLVGIPLFSSALPAGYRFFKMLKDRGSRWKILIGGPHATARAQDTLDVFDGCDFVLRGESERSLVDLVATLAGEGRFHEVKGLSYIERGRAVHNPDADPVPDLDEIPFPARDLLLSAYEKKTYWRIGHRGTTDVMITSRGCPYDCNFCFRISRKYRIRSPENIIQELRAIHAMGTRSVHIMDDLFVYNKPRLLRILEMVKGENLKIKMKVRARVNFIDEEVLAAMKDAGVRSIVYGIESGSQKMLDLMNKRTTVEMNYRAIELTKKAGLQCYADMFLGYPGETPETIVETERLLLKARPTAVNMAVMYPLPNTRVYQEAKRQGTLRDDWDIHGARAWVKLPWIDKLADLYACRKRIMRRYLRHPVVIWNSLKATLPNADFRQFRILLNYFLRLREV